MKRDQQAFDNLRGIILPRNIAVSLKESNKKEQLHDVKKAKEKMYLWCVVSSFII